MKYVICYEELDSYYSDYWEEKTQIFDNWNEAEMFLIDALMATSGCRSPRVFFLGDQISIDENLRAEAEGRAAGLSFASKEKKYDNNQDFLAKRKKLERQGEYNQYLRLKAKFEKIRIEREKEAKEE